MEELFDVLDENGLFTGKTIARDEAHKIGAYHKGVALFLVNRKKQVLMGKRSDTKKQWPGCWDVSAGGHVEAGELGLMSAIREMQEELNIRVKPKNVRFARAHRSNEKDGKVWNAHFNEVFVAFKNLNPKKIKVKKDEVTEVKWVDWADFKNLVQTRNPALSTKWDAYEALIMYVEKYGCQ
ncbi:MAG: NUDIX domain-containing protein [Christensenellaceae bacterium]|jgi:isopentenyl-diphosphate delta-isomerase type 1|nr:NUDIX domain-containing protein [Christensenellaceae bacterium]